MRNSYRIISILFLIIILLPPISLKSQSNDRYYYDFGKKQLYSDVQHYNKMPRPIPVGEGKEIQIEIYGFNPLMYDIVIEDTTFDLFSSNIDDFNNLLNISGIQAFTESSKGLTTTDTKGNKSDTGAMAFQCTISDSINNY